MHLLEIGCTSQMKTRVFALVLKMQVTHWFVICTWGKHHLDLYIISEVEIFLCTHTRSWWPLVAAWGILVVVYMASVNAHTQLRASDYVDTNSSIARGLFFPFPSSCCTLITSRIFFEVQHLYLVLLYHLYTIIHNNNEHMPIKHCNHPSIEPCLIYTSFT